MKRRILNDRVFARTGSGDFIGRTAEFEYLLKHANGKSEANGLALLAVPCAGTSELLRQIYDRLFTGQEGVIPFYFEFEANDQTVRNAARRFLSEFLLQTVAFRRRDAKLIDISPQIHELAELAAPADGYWIDRLVENITGDRKFDDERSFVRNCVSSPMRAAASGARAFVMLDGVDVAARFDGGDAFVDELFAIFSRESMPFVFAGHRRFLFGRTPFRMMSVEPLSFKDAGMMAEQLSVKTGVAINDQTRDLIAVQLGGLPKYIDRLFAAAASGYKDLSSFQKVEQVYTNEIFGGRIGRYLDTVFDRALTYMPVTDMPDIQTNILRLLSEQISVFDGKIPLAYWRKQAGLAATEFSAVLQSLHYSEIINVSAGAVVAEAANIVLSDYVRSRVGLEIDGETRAAAVGDALSENVKRAPELMARFYRKNTAIGLRELMSSFDGRGISPALIDYERFRDEFKGADDEKILKAVREDNARFALPLVVYTAHTAAFYPKLREFCDIERSAVALGFTNAGEKDETAWLAVEIDSKLEADREITEFWCDRLEMVALNSDLTQFKIWLVASEGFEPGAIELLRARNAYGSSRKQVELLARVLGADSKNEAAHAANEYELVVPMGEDTEMIAAHTLEEIARRHHFPSKAINQIKTALVEACINAAEHSHSPDRKTYQKFSVSNDKITITVSNRGVRLSARHASETGADKNRRGWGLKLIKGLMDEVNLEQTDDGTSITMVKFLKSA